MIDNIIFAEKSIKKKSSEGISKSEKKCAQAMRSIVTSQSIKKGERFTTKNLTTKRPCLKTYVPASKFHFALDFIATRDYDIDEHILKKDLKLS